MSESTVSPRPVHQVRLVQVSLVAAAAVLVSGAHATTSTHHAGLHALYEYLYYAPILMAAYWFGLWGGLAAAFACALLYVPHIRITWADNAPYAASQYGEVVAFHMIGGIVGFLVGRLRRSTDVARHTADDLAEKNRELLESYQQLTRAERLSSLGTLAAGLAHEVRTPITAIRGALEILATRAKPATPEAEFTGVATRELSRLHDLLEEFLAYARPSPPMRVPTKIRSLVGQVEALLSAESHKQSVTLLTHFADDGDVIADPAQITQVLVNLLMNAVQASPPGGTVTVAVDQREHVVELTVRDEGPGLPPEVASRVFEPFFTTKAKGTGLGLAVSQRIVAAHHGTITLEPGTPMGTIARVRLPRAGREPHS